MEFQIDQEKIKQAAMNARGSVYDSGRKMIKFFKTLSVGSLILGLVLAAGRFMMVMQSGMGLEPAIVMSFMNLALFLVIALICRSMSRKMRVQLENSMTPLPIHIDGDTLTWEDANGVQTINLMETIVCRSNDPVPTFFLTGGISPSVADDDYRDGAWDLALVDYYAPSLQEYFSGRGFRIHDWDNLSDPACQRPEQWGR